MPTKKTTQPESKIKKVIEKKSRVELVSYTIKAVIPTGPYANIQPEINILASSLEEAKAFVLPHIDELYAKYLNISERKPEEPKPSVVKTISQDSKQSSEISEAFKMANMAISNSVSIPALELISKQINASKRLTDSEKADLQILAQKKGYDINPEA